MPSVDFEDLLAQADKLRDSARVDEAISAYRDIARLATDSHETFFKARAFHQAGVAAKESVLDKESSYYRDARSFFVAAEELYRSLDDQKMLGMLYRDSASCADYAADYPTALIYFQRAVATLEPRDYFGELAATYAKLGGHFFRLGQQDEAMKFIEKSLQIFKKEPTAGYLRASALLDGAKIRFKLGQIEEASDWAEEALSWYRAEHPEKDYRRRQAQLYGLLAAINEERGFQKKAEEFYRHYQKLLQLFDPLAAKVIERDLREMAG